MTIYINGKVNSAQVLLGPGTKINNSVCICNDVSVLTAILQIIKKQSYTSKENVSFGPISYGGPVQGLAEETEAQMALKIASCCSFHDSHCNSVSHNKYNIETSLKEIRCQGVYCFHEDKYVQWKALGKRQQNFRFHNRQGFLNN